MTIKKGLKTIASSVPTTEWGSIEGTLTDQVDLRNALNGKADSNSPSFTGIPTAPTASLNTSNNQLATTKYVTESIIAAGSDLPPMEGHNGEYLKTDGTTTSWSKVDALPSQSGQNGKFLTTNGTTASWANVDVSGYAKLNEENSFTKGQTITRNTEGAILKLIGTTNNTNFLLERSGGSTVVVEAGASVGLIGTQSSTDLQLRTNYTNRMTIGATGSVKLAQDVANNSNDNQVATTKWTHSYVQSRGENLITNGLGTLGDNYNFSSFTFDNGTFKTTEVNTEVKIDEYIPFNSTTHNLSYELYTDNASARYQAFVEFYDKDKTLIQISGQNHLLIGSETSITANTWTNFSTNFNQSVDNALYIKIGWIVGKNVSTCTTKVKNVTLTTHASLYSPNLLGTPTVPTASKGTNTTQIASTAFVKTAVDDVTLTGGDSISIDNKAINYTGTKFVRLATRSWTKAQWEQYCNRGVTTSISPSYTVDGIKVGDLVSVEGIVTDKGNTNVLAWGITQSVSDYNISVLFLGLSYGTDDDNVVHKSGDETISGIKTFGAINNIKMLNSNFALGTVPTTAMSGGILCFFDKNGQRIGQWDSWIGTEGQNTNSLASYNMVGSTEKAGRFSIVVDTAGNDSASATTGVKSSIVGWGMPNYSSGITVSQTDIKGTGFVAPKDGIFIGTFGTSASNGWIYINNMQVQQYGGSNNTHVSVTLPLNKNDVLRIDSTSLGSTTALNFYPLKGVA